MFIGIDELFDMLSWKMKISSQIFQERPTIYCLIVIAVN